ncbi:hypothetical protein Tco_0403366 [Tanacetum coccineum]
MMISTPRGCGEVKKATYRGTQVSREVSLILFLVIKSSGGRRRSNVQPNDDQHREAVGEVKKATYRGTQVSREVSLIEPVSGGGGDLPPGPLPISATTYDTSMIVYLRHMIFASDVKDQWECLLMSILTHSAFGVSFAWRKDDGVVITILWEEVCRNSAGKLDSFNVNFL